MNEFERVEKVLAAIETAIGVARQNPNAGEPTPTDDYIAWCVMNELRRAGFKIVPNEL